MASTTPGRTRGLGCSASPRISSGSTTAQRPGSSGPSRVPLRGRAMRTMQTGSLRALTPWRRRRRRSQHSKTSPPAASACGTAPGRPVPRLTAVRCRSPSTVQRPRSPPVTSSMRRSCSGRLSRRPTGTGRLTDCPERSSRGRRAHVLIDHSRDAGLLVVGSRGLGGLKGMLLGSVSASFAEHAARPVLVLH
ncbi:universal stress protein [Sinomonas flava]|uniref:universal stress protein n=1 Tax=Sinomonas flava TaxID=496857 RepID=UPI0031DF2FBD